MSSDIDGGDYHVIFDSYMANKAIIEEDDEYNAEEEEMELKKRETSYRADFEELVKKNPMHLENQF